jgi:hypothetical protein
MPLHISYTIHGLPDAKMQAVSSAERKVCALVQALCSAQDGRKIGGILPNRDITEAILDELQEHNTPRDRALGWARGIRGEVLDTVPQTEFGGKTLDAYQVDAIRKLTIAGGVLALGCGLGKTITALCAVRSYEPRLNTRRVWIVCPLNAMSSWRPYVKYLDGWDVKIISMDSLHKLAAEPVGGIVIYDEAHLLGSSGARRTKAAHQARIAFDVGLCLTGTFLHGGVEKTLSMLDLAIPGAAGFASKWSAGDYFKCLVRKKVGPRSVTELVRPTGDNRNRLFTYLGRYVVMLSTQSESVRASLTVPDQFIHTIRLNEPWKPLHEEAAHLALQIYEETQQLPHAQEVAHALCRSAFQDKADWLIEQLQDDNEPCVVYAHYHETLDAVCQALEAAGITHVRIDGGSSVVERTTARDRFRAGEVRCFVGQVVATGIGVDGLQEISRYSVSVDHCWRPDVYAQSLARTRRRGQQHETHHIDLIANKLQHAVVERIRAGEIFDRQAREYIEVQQGLTGTTCNHTVPANLTIHSPDTGSCVTP